MIRRVLKISLILIAIGVAGIVITRVPVAEVSADKLMLSASGPKLHAIGAKQQAATIINGAVDPGKIPDQVAYSLLFRMISGRQKEAEKSRIMSYLKQAGLGEADSNALIAAAEEFRERVGILDTQASQIVLTQPPDKKQLKGLEKQKEAIVSDIVASLRHRLSKDGLEKIHQHVNGRVKRNTKIVAPHQSDTTGG